MDVQLNYVETVDEMDEFRRWLGQTRRVLGVDIETTGLSLGTDKIRMVQFGDTETGWAIPYEGRNSWRGLIKYVLDSYEGPVVGHNVKFDAGFLQRDGYTFPWERTHDTMAMAFLANNLGPRGLKLAAAVYIDPSLKNAGVQLEKSMKENKWTWATIPLDLPAYWGYSAADTVLTAKLAEVLWPQVQYARGAYDTEIACAREIASIEQRGVRVDVEYCESKRAELFTELEAVRKKIAPVIPSAPQSVIKALAAEGVELKKRTPGGQLALDEEILKNLAEQGHELAHDVIRCRKLQKEITSFFDNFINYSRDGVVYPSVHQLQAVTGRMSMTSPALQTVPKNGRVRNCFIPDDESELLILCDFDNQELRVAAHLSKDPAMVDAFEHNRDLHMETARKVFGDFEITDEGGVRKRNVGKRGMYAYAYGAGVPVFAKSVGLDPTVAADIYRALGELYPGLRQGMADTTREVRETAGSADYGWITLMDQRRLRVPTNRAYKGFNFKIQGNCAVALKESMVDLAKAGLAQFMRILVHDEIVFSVPRNIVQDVVPIIEECMTRREYLVPLTSHATVVERWGEPYTVND